MTISEIAVTGDRRKTLEALRDRLAVEVERVADDGFCLHCKRGSSSVAPLAAQLTKVLQEIDALPKPQGGTALDELNQRRARRSAPAEGAAGPTGG